MAEFLWHCGRRTIFFSDHSLDQWWDRCKKNEVHGRKQALSLLREALRGAQWERKLPGWCNVSLWHHARAEGFIAIDDRSGFVVNKNPNTHLVAVTYMESQYGNE